MPWPENWARAYSFGHNSAGLRGGRLAHFAYAYADICESEICDFDIAAFRECWESGSYEGTPGEHWYPAEEAA